MNILYILLTILMVLDCIVLVFLVLLQLPKKEAGAGVAFGGAATDALFGAGSGNVLTGATKWASGVFFGLAILMAVMAGRQTKSGAAGLLEQLQTRGSTSTAPVPVAPSTTATPGTGLLQLTNSAPATTAPVPATTAPAKRTNQ